MKDGGIELQGWERDMFAIVRRANIIYLIEFKVATPRLVAWMDNVRHMELTHQELMECLKGIIMTTTAKRQRGTKVVLMTWHQ